MQCSLVGMWKGLYVKWSRVGVNQAKDILDHKSDFLKYEDFESRYKVKTTF